MAALNQLNVKGMKDIQKSLGKERRRLEKAVPQGLAVAGLLLQRESQLLAPVDYGILKASAFTRSEGKGFSTVVNVGYTANYAMYVHENIAMKGKGQPREPGKPGRGNFWDPAGRGQAKFLEQPARTLKPKMFAVIKKVCKL